MSTQLPQVSTNNPNPKNTKFNLKSTFQNLNMERNQPMKRTILPILRQAQRGVTLVELLVVLLIITLLSAAAVPVFVTRIEDARRATARQEVNEIAKAQQLCALAHGVYVPLQLLDDLPAPGPGTPTVSGTDDIANSSSGNNVRLILINIPIEDQDNNQILLNDGTSALAENIRRTWKGPFLNPQRVWTGANNDPNEEVDLTDAEARRDYPLDPYGNPYRFYSPLGILGSNALNGSTASDFDSDNFADNDITTQDDRFDRFAIVSFGPDGFSQNSTNGLVDDDIVFLFGFNPNESTFSLF
jgi:prepilin-type N-terminal cleavage/methylation domain-containing protein